MSGIQNLLLGGSPVAAAAEDPDFEYVTLLLPGNGTNGAQNNTFLDSSTNAFSITRNGNTTQGTFSPFSQANGYWGNYFNASNTSNIKVASQSAFNIGTGNFTVEFFVNFDTWSSTYQRLFMQDTNGGSNFQIGRDTGSNNLFVVIAGSTPISYSWTPNVGQWYHIALVRSGTGTNQLALYIDGSSVATGTSSGSISQQQVIVGGLDWASDYQTRGYISNFRYSNTARTITVPTTPYTSDANTLLLTCQSNRFIDNSSNAFAITINGSTSVQAFSPFAPAAAYDAATNGGSGYFDGSGDSLATPNTSQFAPTGNFTIGLWVYPVTLGTQVYLGNYTTNASTDWEIGTTSTGTVEIYTNGSTRRIQAPAGTLAVGAWSYIALVRDSNTITLYVNGVSQGTYSQSGTFGTATKAINIGNNNSGSAPSNCYISSVSLVDGTATTTVPSAPSTNVSGTSLLCNFTNAGIIDQTGKNNLETVGNAQISTTQYKWGSSSMYFDGTGDFLKFPANPNLSFGTGNFTIEGWVYPTSISVVGSNNPTLVVWNGTSYSLGLYIKTDSTPANCLAIYSGLSGGVNLVGSTAVSTNTWTHFAVTRSGSTIKLFLNGTDVGSTSDSVNYDLSTYLMSVGGVDASNGTITGYIQDLRITKGIARYTANFTPPTAAFPLF